MNKQKVITLVIFLGFWFPALAQWTDNGSSITTNDNVGIGTTSPTQAKLVVNGNMAIPRSNQFVFLENISSSFRAAIGSSNSADPGVGYNSLEFYTNADNTTPRMVIGGSTNTGNVGIGTISPSEKLTVNGNILLPYPGKIIQKRHNVTSEHITASHGQGSGWMVNAAYSGSNNPQNNATYTVNAGNYNTSAGYLDFDGNARRWSFFLSAPSTGIGNSVEFINTFTIDNSEVWLSPTGTQSDFYMDDNGFVGIGTTDPDKKLTVAGTVKSREVIVEENTGADFVFEEEYELPDLSELETYIKTNRHLPEIPTAAQMKEEGVKVGELQMKLLQKIEELTLYVIELEKRDKAKQRRLEFLENQIKEEPR